MANNGKQDGGILAKIIGTAIAAIPVSIIYIGFGVALLLFRPFMKPIVRAFRLKQMSAYWRYLKWLCVPLMWTAFTLYILFFLLGVSHASQFLPKSDNDLTKMMIYFSASLGFSLVFIVMTWLQQCADDTAIQKENAGMAAERFVRKLIERHRLYYPGSRSLHGALFVFNSGTENEYSAEADHIFITQRHIFVIETKYKSGCIEALADAPTWTTSSVNGNGSMRNALLQAKNTARVLKRECSLPDALIPLVAIHGKNIDIMSGPGNVAVAQDLMCVVQAFESQEGRGATLDPEAIHVALLGYSTQDKAALIRHKQRALAAQARIEMEEIVRNASIK